MPLLALILLALTTYLSLHLYNIYKNYLVAKRIGLPIVFAPIDQWGLTNQILRPFLISALSSLPFKTGTWWLRTTDLTWSWESDDRNHERLGRNFVVVGPMGNLLVTADPEAIEHIFAKRKEFIKGEVYEALDIFGRNVDTVNGEDWARHRKITAPCFNERVSGFVWDESLRQTRSMLSHWLSQPSGNISNIVEDTRIVALHVLTAAGFGISHDFLGGARVPSKGHELSHKDSLMTLLNNTIQTVILCQVKWVAILKPILPKITQHILLAISEFEQYMDEMLANERQISPQGQGQLSSKPNLISTLIRTSDQAKLEGVHTSNARLSDEEIKGNIFIFNLAGHDTTANTLAYSVALLAMHPDVQEWVAEEVDAVLGGEVDLVYEEVWPRLRRGLALMYETLRLYGQVVNMPRKTSAPNTPLPLTDDSPSSTSTRTIILPAGMNISVNIHAVHSRGTNFASPHTFNPARWIKKTTDSSGATEELLQPTTFYPWSGGPRICPGMKFAQVEFVGVMATILQRVKILPSVKGGADVGFDAAKKEVQRVLRCSDLTGPTLSLTKPEDLWVKVLERGDK